MLPAKTRPAATPPREGRSILSVQVAAASTAPASIGARVVAFIIDAIVLGLCQFVLGVIIGDVSVVGSLARAVIYAALGFVYFAYSWTAWRASPGQRMLGMVTVSAENGSTLNWNQATMRWAWLFGPSVLNSLFGNQVGGGLGAIVGLVVLAYYIYLLYSAATDPRKQGFHDKQAGTIVATKTA